MCGGSSSDPRSRSRPASQQGDPRAHGLPCYSVVLHSVHFLTNRMFSVLVGFSHREMVSCVCDLGVSFLDMWHSCGVPAWPHAGWRCPRVAVGTLRAALARGYLRGSCLGQSQAFAAVNACVSLLRAGMWSGVGAGPGLRLRAFPRAALARAPPGDTGDHGADSQPHDSVSLGL